MTQPVIQSEFNKHILARMESVEKVAQIGRTVAFCALFAAAIAIVLIIVLH